MTTPARPAKPIVFKAVLIPSFVLIYIILTIVRIMYSVYLSVTKIYNCQGMETIKILQWNVLYKEKSENIIKFLKQTNPDVFCGQELTANGAANPGKDVPAEISKTCNYDYFYNPATVNFEGYDSPFQYGDGIFSRFPIKTKRRIKIQEKEKYGEDRYYTEVDIEISGKLVTIGTVHLMITPFFRITDQRLDEAKKLFEAVKDRHERYILAGDFNAEPDSPIIKKLEEIFIHAGPDIKRPTWTTRPFSYQGFEANSRDWRLDYIFVTEDINIVMDKIIDTPYSDHLPILTEIQI
jgi:endonuclease/exonuclease/phosphatase family metal-dependent hydrolase